MTVEATFWLLCRPRQLPCIEDAWNIPISQEMASRQNNQQNRATAGVAGVAGNAATTQRANSGYGSGGGPQQQVYGYPAQGQPGPGYQDPSDQDGSSAKKLKVSSGSPRAMTPVGGSESPGGAVAVGQTPTVGRPQTPAGVPGAPPAFYLNQQQLQVLGYLQQNQATLNPQQRLLLQQLQQQHRLMQQHKQQLLLQRQQQQQQGGIAGQSQVVLAGQAGGFPQRPYLQQPQPQPAYGVPQPSQQQRMANGYAPQTYPPGQSPAVFRMMQGQQLGLRQGAPLPPGSRPPGPQQAGAAMPMGQQQGPLQRPPFSQPLAGQPLTPTQVSSLLPGAHSPDPAL